MSIPVEIVFRGMAPSKSVEGAVQRWIDRLEHAYARIVRCHVVIEVPHRHHRQGACFHVGVEITAPERTVVVSRDPARDPAHEDVYVAIADAFRAARRQLLDHAQVQRGEVKRHDSADRA